MRLSRLISGFPAVSLLVLALLCVPQASFAATSGGGTPCVVSADANGNPILPPIDCAYFPVIKKFHAQLVDPVTGQLEIGINSKHYRFRNIVIEEGGTLGGTRETFDSTLQVEAANGNGEAVMIDVPAKIVTDTSRFNGFKSIGGESGFQNLETDMRSIHGVVRKNPCFEFLEIIGGTDNGAPSPGNITLNPQEDGTWVANSTFNVSVTVRYVGSEDGPFAGQSGTFEGTVTVEAGGLQ